MYVSYTPTYYDVLSRFGSCPWQNFDGIPHDTRYLLQKYSRSSVYRQAAYVRKYNVIFGINISIKMLLNFRQDGHLVCIFSSKNHEPLFSSYHSQYL